jgi:hypothetical protein
MAKIVARIDNDGQILRRNQLGKTIGQLRPADAAHE